MITVNLPAEKLFHGKLGISSLCSLKNNLRMLIHKFFADRKGKHIILLML